MFMCRSLILQERVQAFSIIERLRDGVGVGAFYRNI